MDPRVSWYQPELLTKANELWTQVWLLTQMHSLTQSQPPSSNGHLQKKNSTNTDTDPTSVFYNTNKNQDDQEIFRKYIEANLNLKNSSHVNGFNHQQQTQLNKNNKASTYGFNYQQAAITIPQQKQTHNDLCTYTTPWLYDTTFFPLYDDGIRLIKQFYENNSELLVYHPAKYLITYDPAIPVIELDEGFLR